jgi:uncharacterized protein YqeY
MGLREQFTEQLKVSMKAGDAPRTSTLRMVLARLKDVDIALPARKAWIASRMRMWWRLCAAW